MTARKRKTGNRKLSDAPASALNKPLEETINKEKIKKFRGTLLKEKGPEQVAKMLKESPKEIFAVAELLGDHDRSVQANAAVALGKTAGNGADITIAIPALVKTLGNERSDIRGSAAEALGDAAKNGADISVAIPALMNALGDTDWNERFCAAGALGNAAWKTDISVAIPALMNALGDTDSFVRWNASGALGKAASKGVDITVAISVLAKTLGDENSGVRKNAAEALGNAASKDHETRVAVTKAIMDFMNSHGFMVEAEKNSDRFIETIKTIDELARKIDSLERKAA
jgi:RNA 3'-terminal phosphate cyclase